MFAKKISTFFTSFLICARTCSTFFGRGKFWKESERISESITLKGVVVALNAPIVAVVVVEVGTWAVAQHCFGRMHGGERCSNGAVGDVCSEVATSRAKCSVLRPRQRLLQTFWCQWGQICFVYFFVGKLKTSCYNITVNTSFSPRHSSKPIVRSKGYWAFLPEYFVKILSASLETKLVRNE